MTHRPLLISFFLVQPNTLFGREMSIEIERLEMEMRVNRWCLISVCWKHKRGGRAGKASWKVSTYLASATTSSKAWSLKYCCMAFACCLWYSMLTPELGPVGATGIGAADSEGGVGAEGF